MIKKDSKALFFTLKHRLLRPDMHLVDDYRHKLLKPLGLIYCKNINNERKGKKDPKSARYFSHVGHIDNFICIAKDFDGLDLPVRLGILLHEIGHIWTQLGEEPEADLEIFNTLGIIINYTDDMELEYINNGEFFQYFRQKGF